MHTVAATALRALAEVLVCAVIVLFSFFGWYLWFLVLSKLLASMPKIIVDMQKFLHRKIHPLLGYAA